MNKTSHRGAHVSGNASLMAHIKYWVLTEIRIWRRRQGRPLPTWGGATSGRHQERRSGPGKREIHVNSFIHFVHGSLGGGGGAQRQNRVSLQKCIQNALIFPKFFS
jgi:hypothetical protein